MLGENARSSRLCFDYCNYGYLLVAYAMYLLFSFCFLGLHISQLQARTSWVEHWSRMIFRHGIMCWAEFDAEHDCIAAAYEITQRMHFCITWVHLVISTNKLHKRDKSSKSHSHLGMVGVESRSLGGAGGWGGAGRLMCHLTDEYTHAFGHLAGAERITGRGSGTSSSRPTTGKSRRRDEDEAFI